MKKSIQLTRKITAWVLACTLALGSVGTGAFAAINNRTRDGAWISPVITEAPQEVSKPSAAPEEVQKPESAPAEEEKTETSGKQEEAGRQVPDAPADGDAVNLALNGTASSNGVEADSVAAANAIDGVIAENSRWGSTYGFDQKWFQVDLGKVCSVEYIVLEWERKNVSDYLVQTSADGENWTDVYTAKAYPEDFTERIDLDAPLQARYVKLTINAFVEDAPKRDGTPATWATVSLYEFEVFGQPGEDPDPDIDYEENISRKGTATANGNEAGTSFTASRAIDGVVDRKADGGSNDSRWASPKADGPHWLKVDFGKQETVKGIAIEWERRNATDYVIELSDNNTDWTTVYTATQASASYREIINLPEAHKARYLRLTINRFNSNSEGVDWNTVSVFELEAYRGDVPVNVSDPSTVAASLTVAPVQKGDTKLAISSEVPEGYTVELVGANYEQVIGSDMTIYPPVSDTEVKVQFKVIKGEQSAKSQDITVAVPGAMTEPANANEKPDVIPALREWVGGKGDFTVSSATRVVVDEAYALELMNAAYTFADDYQDVTGRKTFVTTGTEAGAHSFFLTLDTGDQGLGDEGYYLRIGDSLTLEGAAADGVFLGTRSVLQILKQNGDSIPQGVTRDYPEFKVRGFMFDVARRPVSLDFVQEIMKTMSWYKMNDLQLHLNDNYIDMANYATVEEGIEKGYAGFRLESEVIGDNGQQLTSPDLYYTKEEFRDLIKLSDEYGVNIVPEFDSPGHALAFVKVHPEYVYTGPSTKPRENAAMLDVTNPDAVDFVKSVFDEYLEPQNGEERVFSGNVFHVGADEFYGDAEHYRAYADDILKFVKEKGITPRIWGSLSVKAGSTPVIAEGVQMDIWNGYWCRPTQMYNLGYDMINIMDGNLYMVPGANYYKDYLDTQYLFNNWTPNNFEGTVISACDPQVLGGAFALWNDKTGIGYNGITEYDMFDRIYPSMQVLSEKCWGANTDKTYNEFKELANEVNYAPNTNPRHEVESKDDTVISYSFDDVSGKTVPDASGNGYNATIKKASIVDGKDGKGLALTAKNSYVQLPVENMGPTYSMSMWVKRTSASTQEQVLLESSKGKLKAVQAGTGKVGFSRDGMDYSFNYTLPVDEWVKIGIVGQLTKTKLFVNDAYVDEISRTNTIISNTTDRTTVSVAQYGTFVMPLSILGSRTKAFQGVIDDFTISKGDLFVDKSLLQHSKMTATATSETNPASGNDGPASYAIDDDESTIWHTRYSPTKDTLPQSITLTFDQAYAINKFTYLPRTSGPNGIITTYTLEVKNEEGSFVQVASGNWANNADLKTVTFDPVSATAIRLTATAGGGGFASAAELNVYKSAVD